MTRRPRIVWRPTEDQMRLWPGVSGNALNGVDEPAARRPTPIYWHPPDSTPHGPLQRFFYARTASGDPAIVEARAERQRAVDAPLVPLAPTPIEHTAEEWSAEVKRVALEAGAQDVGITAMRTDYVFEGHEAPTYRWMIVVAVGQDYDALKAAPSARTLVEITRQYGRGTLVAKALANRLRTLGHEAFPYGGPMAGSFLLIPPAIAAGLGELGKHGSMIHRTLGANFRLACVLTSVPLIPDAPVAFGADDFCAHCRVCSDECPPDAILSEKTLIRGERRWYVDFDKCLPYFNENMGCGICLAVCPFSRPVIGTRLVDKLALKRASTLPLTQNIPRR